MANFIDVLSEARRRSMLSGQPFTAQEVNGIGAGWFDSAAAVNNKKRALELSEKNAADRLAMERYTTQQQIEAAKKAQQSQMYGNILQSGTTALGTDYMVSKPGESMISKGAGLIKDVGGNIINYGKDLFGMGSESIPTFSDALTPALIDATGTGAGVSLLPEAGGTIEAGLSGNVAAGGAELATELAPELAADVLATGASDIGNIGIGLSDVAGLAGDTISSFMPYLGYYGLAKGAGTIINMITDNNPDLKETPFGRLGGSLSEPLAVEQYWADELADHGIGNPRTNEIVADVLNPIGGLITDTENTVKMIATGGLSNISSDTDIGAAILTGGVSALLGTFVCTELYRQGYLTEAVFAADAKFGAQMNRIEYNWYKTWGVPLAVRMKKSKIISRIVSFFMKPVSLYMASEMGVGNGSLFGKINFKVLQLVCRWRMK